MSLSAGCCIYERSPDTPVIQKRLFPLRYEKQTYTAIRTAMQRIPGTRSAAARQTPFLQTPSLQAPSLLRSTQNNSVMSVLIGGLMQSSHQDPGSAGQFACLLLKHGKSCRFPHGSFVRKTRWPSRRRLTGHGRRAGYRPESLETSPYSFYSLFSIQLWKNNLFIYR